MPIFFLNPGEIDIRAATVVGLNVKSSDGAIGRFGTGLKYAISVLLRERQTIRIYSGMTSYSFRTKVQVIRGKEFNFVHMKENEGPWKELSMTTEYGKDWNLQMAYRELYSNMLDEGGVEVFDGGAIPSAGMTVIVVEGREFAQVHKERFGNLLLPRGLRKLSSTRILAPFEPLEIYNSPSNHVYYRGIAAYELKEPSMFTYNITAPMPLTENRTLDFWAIAAMVMTAAKSNTHEGFAERILCPKQDSFESKFNWYAEFGWSQETLDTLDRLDQESPLDVAPSARAELLRLRPSVQMKKFKHTSLADAEEGVLRSTIDLLNSFGFPVEREQIKVVEDLGNHVTGRVYSGMIYISSKLFRDPPALIACLIEQIGIIQVGSSSDSQEFKNYLLVSLARLVGGRELKGKEKTLPPKGRVDKGRPFSDEIPF